MHHGDETLKIVEAHAEHDFCPGGSSECPVQRSAHKFFFMLPPSPPPLCIYGSGLSMRHFIKIKMWGEQEKFIYENVLCYNRVERSGGRDGGKSGTDDSKFDSGD